MNEEKIAKKIKALRKTRGLTQQQLADALGVQRATISNYEIGRREPSISDLEKIGKVLGVSLEYFGVACNDIRDLIARARFIFDDPEISHEDKANVYKEVMRLYLKMDD